MWYWCNFMCQSGKMVARVITTHHAAWYTHNTQQIIVTIYTRADWTSVTHPHHTRKHGLDNNDHHPCHYEVLRHHELDTAMCVCCTKIQYNSMQLCKFTSYKLAWTWNESMTQSYTIHYKPNTIQEFEYTHLSTNLINSRILLDLIWWDIRFV